MLLRIAVVKSSVYQDLWVSDITQDPFHVFKTSMMRCPAVGLSEKFATDYIIVKESWEYPCQVNKNCLPEDCISSMKYSKERKNPSLSFLDESYHGYCTLDSVAHDAASIDWSVYTMVLCINTCIPAIIIQQYRSTLWCYWVGENEENLVQRPLANYNLILNQDVTKVLPSGIGFPYTFLGPNTMERFIEENGMKFPGKYGIYMEINTTNERPVRTIPEDFQYISYMTCMPIIKHHQNILTNLSHIARSKYYVKIAGRIIRGNSVLETISAGTLVLANRNLLMYSDLVPDECHVVSREDVIQRILYYEANPPAYVAVLEKQRDILRRLYFDQPVERLLAKYSEFMKNITPSRCLTISPILCTEL